MSGIFRNSSISVKKRIVWEVPSESKNLCSNVNHQDFISVRERDLEETAAFGMEHDIFKPVQKVGQIIEGG
jgi:hypothetical protein